MDLFDLRSEVYLVFSSGRRRGEDSQMEKRVLIANL